MGIPWSSRKYPLDKTEFIAPVDVNPYAKEHLHTTHLWNIILNHLTIKALTSDIPWHNLDKNYIDLWLLLMYIPTQEASRNWMDSSYISIKWLLSRVEIVFDVEYFSLFTVSFSLYVYLWNSTSFRDFR